MEYRAVYYKNSATGEQPALTYVNALSEKERAKVKSFIDLLIDKKGYLDEPYAKKVVGTKFRELIIGFGHNEHRIPYFNASDKRLVLLHGYLKKNDKMQARENLVATKNYDDFRSYDY